MQRMRRVYFSISFSLPTVSSVRQGRSPSTLTPEAFSVNIHSRQSSECPCHSKEEDRKTKVRKEMLFFLLPWGKISSIWGPGKNLLLQGILLYIVTRKATLRKNPEGAEGGSTVKREGKYSSEGMIMRQEWPWLILGIA